MRPRCFTLIETLAVVVLVGVVSVMGLGALVNTDSPSARLDGFVRSLRDLDRTARLMAREDGLVRMALEHKAIVVSYVHGDGRNGDVLKVPAEVTLSLTLDGAADVSEILIDRQGRSDDIRWIVLLSEERSELVIAGLTGWSEVESP